MFPFRDHNPSLGTPWVTWALIALNCAVYVLTASWGFDLRRLWVENALWPPLVMHGEALHGMVTYMFLHGGILHLAGNMLFLWVFGDNLEDRMGHGVFLGVYLICGVVAGLAFALSAPGQMAPLVGASGAIAGVMGGYLLFYPRARIDVLFFFVVFYKIWPAPAWLVLGAWFALQVASELISGAGSQVAHMAHIAGFLAGLVMCLPLWLVLGGPMFWIRTRGHPPHPEIHYRPSPIPNVRRRR